MPGVKDVAFSFRKGVITNPNPPLQPPKLNFNLIPSSTSTTAQYMEPDAMG
jgi:hypothetical protein